MTEDRTISLNAVKEMIKGLPDWSITKNAFAYRINVEDLMKGLDDLPPVTPNDEDMTMQYQRGYIDGFKEGKATFEPKTGHWKRISMDRYTTHAQYWYECDKCGEHNLGNTDWCPNCGCRMIEQKEGGDKE